MCSPCWCYISADYTEALHSTANLSASCPTDSLHSDLLHSCVAALLQVQITLLFLYMFYTAVYIVCRFHLSSETLYSQYHLVWK